MSPRNMAFVLALVFTLSPLAIDMYLPAFTAIAADLAVSTQDIAITISIYILGFSSGQFLGGPLSDYHGRRRVMLSGLAVFCASSLVLAMATKIEIFWLFRFIQALGGGVAAVVVPAVIRDHTEGQEAARLFTLIGLITIIAPAIAPALGTALFMLNGWRMIFFALAGFTALVFFVAARQLLKLVAPPPPSASETLWQRYRHVLSNSVAMRYLLAQGLVLGVMMTFLANASLVYMEKYGVNESVFSALFAGNIVVMAGFNRLNNLMLKRIPAGRIVVPAIGLQSVAAVGLLAITGFAPPLWAVVPLVMLAVGVMSCVMGNGQACALDFFPHHSGVAAALMGSGQFLIAAMVSGISTQFHSELIWPMSVTMAAASLLALVIVPSYETWRDRRGAQVEAAESRLSPT